MNILICTQRNVAKPLIKALKLRVQRQITRFQIYSDIENWTLAICGEDAIEVATLFGYLFGRFSESISVVGCITPYRPLPNSAKKTEEHIALFNAIRGSRRDYYPDMLQNSPLPQTQAIAIAPRDSVAASHPAADQYPSAAPIAVDPTVAVVASLVLRYMAPYQFVCAGLSSSMAEKTSGNRAILSPLLELLEATAQFSAPPPITSASDMPR